MSVFLTPNAKQQFFTDSGAPAAGYKLYTYAHGTSYATPLATYANADGSTANANPIVLDSRGEAVLYLTAGSVYDYVLKDADGTTKYTRDGVQATTGDAAQVNFTPSGTGAVARTLQDKGRELVTAKDFDAVADGTTADDTALAKLVAEAFAQTGQGVTDGGGTCSPLIIDGRGLEYLITEPIVIPTGSGVRFKNMRLLVSDDFDDTNGSYVFMTGAGDVIDAGDANKIKHTDIEFDYVYIDGRHVGSIGGIYLKNCWGVKIHDTCSFVHCAGRAIGVDRESRTVTCHDITIGDVYIREWTENEPAHPVIGDGYSDASLRTGTGIWLNSPDCLIGNVKVGYCKYPLDIDYAGNSFAGGHYYAGSIDMTHELNDAGTQIGIHSTVFMGTFFDNQTDIVLHNPGSGVNFPGCVFFSPETYASATPARWFLTVAIDTSGEAGFTSYHLNVVGCGFRAPATTFGSVVPFKVTTTGVNGSALVGSFTHNTFANVPKEDWSGVYSSTVTAHSFDNRVAGESTSLSFRDAGTIKWTLEKKTDNSFRLFNNAAVLDAVTVNIANEVGLPDLSVSKKLRTPSAGTLTIASGVVTVTGSRHRVDTEAAAATDDLATITATDDGAFLVLGCANSARVVTVKDGTGNIELAGGDFVLDNVADRLFLQYDSGLAKWCEIARSNNA